jgi:hypothetical protein
MSRTAIGSLLRAASLLLPLAAVSPSQAAAGACIFNGQNIASGGSVSAYQAGSVVSGGQCVSQTRTCTDGTLSGTYGYSGCIVASAPGPGSSCVAYNTTYANGSTLACTIQPGAGYGCPLGRAFSQWTCSNGQWVAH